MSLYQPGDIVRVVRPEDTREFPTWNSDMNPYEGRDLVVKSVSPAAPAYREQVTVYTFESCPYLWRESWLVPVEDDSDELSVADDSDIHNLLSL